MMSFPCHPALALLVITTAFAGCTQSEAPLPPSIEPTIQEPVFTPHVVVATQDTGINPYHEVFHRPNNTMHPCMYLEGFDCSIPELPLTIGSNLSFSELVEKDAGSWSRLQVGDWFWVPKTNIVALGCSAKYSPTLPNLEEVTNYCGLSDTDGHGTHVASQIVAMAPGVSLIVAEGQSFPSFVATVNATFDIQTRSVGDVVPIPGPVFEMLGDRPVIAGLMFNGAGNDPLPAALSSITGDPAVISVTGGYGVDGSELRARKTADVMQDYCALGALHDSVSGFEVVCGTSFSAPRAAGLAAQLILDLREFSKYSGLRNGSVLDSVLGVSVRDVRDAINRSSTYGPVHSGPQWDFSVPVPIGSFTPWVQMGWGYITNDTMRLVFESLTGGEPLGEKPVEVVAFMEALYVVRGIHPSPVGQVYTPCDHC